MNKTEIWSSIDRAPDYEVSNIGRVRRSLTAIKRNSTKRGRMLSLKSDKNTGYVRVSLRSRDGKLLREQVHRLVARAFLGDHRRGCHVNHIDGNKENNEASNLEWCTPQENVRHAWRTGLSSPSKGEDHGGSKLKKRDVEVIRDADKRGVQLGNIAEVFNVTLSTISLIVRNKTWKEE
jgi:hypothetical protein